MRAVIIVGAGPAGCAAAIQCGRLGVEPILMDATGSPGGLIANGFSIENYPGLEAPIPGSVFAARLKAQLDRFGVEVIHSTVRKVSRRDRGYSVLTSDGEMGAENVIIATGTTPLKLNAPGMDVLYETGKVHHEVAGLLTSAGTLDRVVVVGGGEASCDYALSLARAGTRVDLLCRGSSLKAKGRLVELMEKYNEIKIHRNSEIKKTSMLEDEVEVEFKDNSKGTKIQTIQCHALLVAVGRRTETDRILDGIPGDMQGPALTRAPGLFICGDARLDSLGQAGIAVGDGLWAAMEIAGANRRTH